MEQEPNEEHLKKYLEQKNDKFIKENLALIQNKKDFTDTDYAKSVLLNIQIIAITEYLKKMK